MTRRQRRCHWDAPRSIGNWQPAKIYVILFFMKNSFHPYAATTILVWALAFPLTKLALESFSPFSLGFLRYAAASVALLALCLITRMPLPKMRDLPWFALAGLTGFFLYMVAFNTGMLRGVTSATSSVIIAGVPVITAGLATLFFRERLRGIQWFAIVVEFMGVLILALYGAVFTTNIGTLWLILSALLVSCYNLLQRRLTRTYSALQVTAYSVFAGTILLAIFAPGAARELPAAPLSAMVYVLILGLLSSAVGYIAWAKAFQKAERTSQAANYMFFTPFLAGLLGFLFAGEVPDASTWIGGGVILLGAGLFNWTGRKRNAD